MEGSRVRWTAWLSVALVTIGLPRGLAAQQIEAPLFHPGPPIENDPYTVDVSVGTDGSIVFIWEESSPYGGDPRSRAVTHWFSPEGVALTPVRIADTENFVFRPLIAADPRGGHIAAWNRRDDESSRFLMRRLNAAGAAAPGRPDVQVEASNKRVQWGKALASLPAGSVFTWAEDSFLLGRRFAHLGLPLEPPFVIAELSDFHAGTAVEALPDGGFVVLWGRPFEKPRSFVRIYGAAGEPRSDAISLGSPLYTRLAVSPEGVIAAIGQSEIGESLIQRLDLTGALIGVPLVVENNPFLYPRADLDFDHFGNLIAVWSADGGPWASAFDRDGVPLGPPLLLDPASAGALEPRVARMREDAHGGSGFVIAWTRGALSEGLSAAIVSLGNLPPSSCGNGVPEAHAEQCDDGAANSDTAPGGCRTNCLSAACGDGIVDPGEECDDSNRASCDGCSVACLVEPLGTICGDGLTARVCGEQCDDGNRIPGDGCSGDCINERVPGGGSKRSDCLIGWVVDNPVNAPYRDKRGALNREQVCVDNDPLCDHDGGVVGSCTFRVGACANHSGGADCAAGAPATWELRNPSRRKASRSPGLAAFRSQLVASAKPLLTSGTPEVCSELFELPVELRGVSGSYREGRLSLSMRSIEAGEGGRRDSDRLKLVCLPGSDSHEPVLFAQVYEGVLKPNCTFCHNSVEPCCNFLDFTTPALAWQSLLGLGRDECAGTPRLVPGDPEASLLYQKLANPHGDVCGAQMPAQMTFPETFSDCTGEACLGPEERALVRRWILGGARPD